MAGTLVIDTLKASSGVLATQNGMTGIAKAWVNFAGASGAINGSFNVSSVTRSGTGHYRINFTTAMPNANYGFSLAIGSTSGDSIWPFAYIPNLSNGGAPTTTSCGVNTGTGSTDFDPIFVGMSFFA